MSKLWLSLWCSSWSTIFLSWLIVKRRGFTVIIDYFILVIILHLLHFPHRILIQLLLRNKLSKLLILRMLGNKLGLVLHKRKLDTRPRKVLNFLFSLLVVAPLLLSVGRVDLGFSRNCLRLLSGNLLSVQDLNRVLLLLLLNSCSFPILLEILRIAYGSLTSI